MPLIPRIQQTFASRSAALYMSSHSNLDREKSTELHGLSDSKAWEEVDRLYPKFLYEPRHLRIAIATDGFNPFSLKNSQHTVWPVVIVIYNLFHTMTTKSAFMLLTMIISVGGIRWKTWIRT